MNLQGSKAVIEIRPFSLELKPSGVADAQPLEILRSIYRAIIFRLISQSTTSREDGELSAELG